MGAMGVGGHGAMGAMGLVFRVLGLGLSIFILAFSEGTGCLDFSFCPRAIRADILVGGLHIPCWRGGVSLSFEFKSFRSTGSLMFSSARGLGAHSILHKLSHHSGGGGGIFIKGEGVTQ